MSYYGGTVTVAGRRLITSLLAGETIELTRIMVGSGSMPEGVEPIDMTDLAAPVAEATSTAPTAENNVLSMVVEYRNDMNGGLEEGFWLREFGIYARTEKSAEVLIYYATLGDSPQPVNAFDGRRVDIRRYPVTIALEVSADVQVSYNPGAFITAEEAQQLIQSMVSETVGAIGTVVVKDILIPAEGWEADPDTVEEEYPLHIDVACEEAAAAAYPDVALDRPSLRAAQAAGLCSAVQTLDGAIRFWAARQPSSAMTGTVALLFPGGRPLEGNGGTSGGELPVASETTLGGVKIRPGSGLTIAADGSLGLDTATVADAESLFTASKP